RRVLFRSSTSVRSTRRAVARVRPVFWATSLRVWLLRSFENDVRTASPRSRDWMNSLLLGSVIPELYGGAVRLANNGSGAVRRLGSCLQVSEDCELLGGGGLGHRQSVGDLQLPSRLGSALFDVDSRMDGDEPQHVRLRIRLEDAEIGDDDRGPGAAMAATALSPATEADRRDEVDLGDECPAAVTQHHDHLPGRGGYLRRPAGPRQPDVGLVVPSDDGRVEVAEAVDLGGRQEPD